MTRPSHAALVEEVAKAIGGKLIELTGQVIDFDECKELARAALRPTQHVLSEVSPEMVEVVARSLCVAARQDPDKIMQWSETASSPHWHAWADDARAAISAFLAASPLTPGEKGEG